MVKKVLKVSAVAVGVLLLAASVLPTESPADRCKREYAFDSSAELACLMQADYNAHRDAWRSSH